ncbi:MAG: hypothetical protein JWO92_2495 [Chitinophagaceae bacterium]|nr:hypothetical protein [Chitinophagaceae bacterium]
MITGNEPAMPAMDTNYKEGIPNLELRYEGLTIRQHFAAMAMQGIMSQSHLQAGNKGEWTTRGHGWGEDVCNQLNKRSQVDAMCVAEFAVQIADALINELNKEK